MSSPGGPHSGSVDDDAPSAEPVRIDPAIVAGLFVRHADELRRFLTGVLRNHEQANDVMQIAFAKAIELGHTARQESLKAWLFRVAYHEAIALRRRFGVQSRANDELAARGPKPQMGPLAQATHRETVDQVRAALDRLPPEQRQVVHLRMYEEKKFAVIAAELNLPLGTVLTRMQLALKKLRKMLDNDV